MNKPSSLLLFLLVACGSPLPQLDGIDLEKWRTDKNGCQGERLRYLAPLQTQREKLKGLSQDEVVELLGRPDKNELYKRNQKFFFYSLSPGKECGTDSSHQQLSIRFNAMGLAKEVVIE
ncbi:MAG: hypothetical protein ACKOE6_03170 [Flammeovirgaceae bacterium]